MSDAGLTTLYRPIAQRRAPIGGLTFCGETHGHSIAVLGAEAPQYWYDLPPAERSRRAVLSSDQCVIDEKYFFVLGRLLLPVAPRNTHSLPGRSRRFPRPA